MIALTIPPARRLALEHLCLDLNGTIAFGGGLLPGVEERLRMLDGAVAIHVVTADTNGNAAALLWGLPLTMRHIEREQQGKAKADYIRTLGAKSCVCMGNGFNDREMLQEAGLSIAILGREGTSPHALGAADIVIADVLDGLDLLLCPERIIATLRD